MKAAWKRLQERSRILVIKEGTDINKKRLLSAALLAAALVLILLWSVAFAADEPTSYVDENGNTQTVTATVVDASMDTLTGDWYVVKGNVTRNGTITVSGDARLILADGASLTVYGSTDNAGINVSGSNNLTIYGQAEGTGTLSAQGVKGAGIGGGYNQDGGTIAIHGGKVTAMAVGNSGGAGLGGGSNGNGGTIIISGGSLTAGSATGGGAAIGGGAELPGSGKELSAGSITISGGIVNARSNYGGAGIGGGTGGDGGDITISGGMVFAEGGDSMYGGAAIGSGQGGVPGHIVISGGSVQTDGDMTSAPLNGDGTPVYHTVINLFGLPKDKRTRVDALTTGAGYTYGTNDLYTDENSTVIHVWLPEGTETTAARITDGAAIPTRQFYMGNVTTSSDQTETGVFYLQAFSITSVETGYTYQDNVLTFTQPGDYIISQAFASTMDRIRVNVPSSSGTVNFTLDNVNINASSVENAAAFDMTGANVNLKLVGTNSLSSGKKKAGLLCPHGASLTITADSDSSGSLTATGGFEGAGIGGVDLVSGGNITINGGTVTANSGGYAAGIGSGFMWDLEQIYVNHSNIIINDGIVTANGGSFGAGIGGGPFSGSGTVVINNGKVTATGGEAGAGIGSGMGGDGGNIEIGGGNIIARSGSAAGIGGGNGGNGVSILISGGTVTAESNYSAGIGGGDEGEGGTISISGGVIAAKSGQSAGIGGGYEGGTGTVSLTGGVIYAQGGDAAKDIGPGKDYPGADGSLTISDTAAVFLRSGLDGCITPATSTHSAYSLANEAAGESQYGIPVPWAGDFGAYLRLYTLAYSNNGGTGTLPPAVTQHIGTTTAIAGIGEYTRTGYALGAAWNSKPDGSGTPYAPSNEFEFTANTTLYALWTPIQYTITYNLNGGTNNPANPATYTVEDEVTLLEPTREGYIFAGWTGTGIPGDDPVLEVIIEQGSTGDREYTAHWLLPFRTLTDSATGISVSGYIRSDATLTVGGMALHDDACEACKAIRQRMKNDDYVLLLGKDISLSQDYSGTLTITIPVAAKYNGQIVTILHCAGGTLKTYTVKVSAGKAVFEVTTLSPFAVFAKDIDYRGGLPRTGHNSWAWWLLCGGMVMGLAALIMFSKKEKACTR